MISLLRSGTTLGIVYMQLIMIKNVEAAQKLCAEKGCSFLGNNNTNNSAGFKCSCLAYCQELDTCCEDYYEVCGIGISE